MEVNTGILLIYISIIKIRLSFKHFHKHYRLPSFVFQYHFIILVWFNFTVISYLLFGVEVIILTDWALDLCLRTRALLGVPSTSDMKLISPDTDGTAITCVDWGHKYLFYKTYRIKIIIIWTYKLEWTDVCAWKT